MMYRTRLMLIYNRDTDPCDIILCSTETRVSFGIIAAWMVKVLYRAHETGIIPPVIYWAHEIGIIPGT